MQALLDQQVEIELAGFEVPEVDLIIGTQLPRAYDQALDDCPPARTDGEAISRKGDVWICGKHRVLCGDARSKDDMLKLMKGTGPRYRISEAPEAPGVIAA